eukprot:CAMPEP_0172063124 /NCGR_PEP_ID=MMETSP1043-20130122/9407_1 /TAXON_ID=464988 /ORGANISM="Hemiselmis andersenii, Strain CCMP441" /LENGTH=49 /DNA_ID=CAMNT_0012723089 /DNA_START=88 /DNA_END=238 /DNA_ORIENTATION=+
MKTMGPWQPAQSQPLQTARAVAARVTLRNSDKAPRMRAERTLDPPDKPR